MIHATCGACVKTGALWCRPARQVAAIVSVLHACMQKFNKDHMIPLHS